MSSLKGSDSRKFEKLFGMESGYVLDFSNRTFQDFIYECIGTNIYDIKYDGYGGSKANRVRGFWQVESNYNVHKLNSALLETWRTNKLASNSPITSGEQILYEECLRINERIQQETLGEHIDAIKPNSDDIEFSILAQTVRESIQKGQPEAALDRLHTFIVKYTRNLCDKHKILYDKEKPLHSIFGEYVKHLNQNKMIESPMTERILKTAISVLEAFNQVRNSNSLAHANQILNYNESLLIFKNISSLVEFIDLLESSLAVPLEQVHVASEEYDDLPF